MIIKFEIAGTEYMINDSNGTDISIPLDFHGDQPNTYDVDFASAIAFESGDIVGDTRRGGSCNFEQYKFIPHCNGTHTECVGHISLERIHINRFASRLLIPVTLISVKPEDAETTIDTYDPPMNKRDKLITESILASRLGKADKDFLHGLIVRTIPNDDSKRSRRYSSNEPPYFSIEAMEYICTLGVQHLIVDMPSVDRAFDEGKLTAHHIFWNVVRGSHDIDVASASPKTITEMVYVNESISDGRYFASVQIPNFCADAGPSRVILYRAEQIPERLL